MKMNKNYSVAYPTDKNRLFINRWMFISEGMERGYKLTRIHKKRLMIYVEKKGKGFIYDALPGSATARIRFPQIIIKDFQKKIMKASGIPVAKTFGIVKTVDDLKKITCQFPCVVKPLHGTLGKNVFVNINTQKELYDAVNQIVSSKAIAIIEEQYLGKQYRMLMVGGKFISCVERCPASIVGDGVHTLQELIDIKNTDPQRGPRHSNTHTMHYIGIDKNINDQLKKTNIKFNDVIKKNKKIIFGASTPYILELGGDIVDKTNETHQSFIDKCENFVQRHSLFIIGFDVIAKDITKDTDKQKYIFNELNEQPFFDMNEKCNIGTGLPVSKILWDEIEKSDIMTEQFLLF